MWGVYHNVPKLVFYSVSTGETRVKMRYFYDFSKAPRKLLNVFSANNI